MYLFAYVCVCARDRKEGFLHGLPQHCNLRNERESSSPKFQTLSPTLNPKKLETGLRTNSAGIPHTLLLRIESIGFPKT